MKVIKTMNSGCYETWINDYKTEHKSEIINGYVKSCVIGAVLGCVCGKVFKLIVK